MQNSYKRIYGKDNYFSIIISLILTVMSSMNVVKFCQIHIESLIFVCDFFLIFICNSLIFSN